MNIFELLGFALLLIASDLVSDALFPHSVALQLFALPVFAALIFFALGRLIQCLQGDLPSWQVDEEDSQQPTTPPEEGI